MKRVRLQLISDANSLDKNILNIEELTKMMRNRLSGPVRDDEYMGSEDLTTYHVEFFYDNDRQLSEIVDGLTVLSFTKVEGTA